MKENYGIFRPAEIWRRKITVFFAQRRTGEGKLRYFLPSGELAKEIYGIFRPSDERQRERGGTFQVPKVILPVWARHLESAATMDPIAAR